MQHLYPKQPNRLHSLIAEYEAMSQKGTVAFFEKTVYHQLLDHYERKQDWLSAMTVAENAIGQHTFSADLYIRKACLLMRNARIEDALVTLDTAACYSPNDLQIILLRVDLLALQGDYDEALAQIEIAKEMSGLGQEERSDIYLSQAHLYENMRQYRNMFSALRRALRLHPHNESAHERLIWAVEYAQCYQESVELNTELTDREPFSHWAWYNLGYALACLGNTEAAIEAYEFAFAIDEKFELALRECARVCIETEQYRKALRCYENLLDHFEPDSELLCHIAHCYAQLEAYQTANTFLMKALQLNPRNHEAHFQLGECCALEGQWDLAIRAYRAAIVLEQHCEAYHIALGDALLATDNDTEALACYRRAAYTAPEEAEHWLRYVRQLMLMKKYKRALKTLAEAELYAACSELVYCRVACLWFLERQREAMYELGEVLLVDFEQHLFLYELCPPLLFDTACQRLIASF
jgi:tetratricopeptide (TPR) repeat protein